MNAVTEMTIGQKIIDALDGRTQRWLALNAAIPENDLSKKLKGKMDFTQEEIDKINSILKSKIKLSA